MKNFKRIISVILLFCTVISLLPRVTVVRAAQTVTRYVLDKDGVIDTDATYLIVNTATVGSANALQLSADQPSKLSNKSGVTVQKEEDGTIFIEGFTGDTDCQFIFSGASSGSITHGNYKLDLDESQFAENASKTLNFKHLGNGAYTISYTGKYLLIFDAIYYLQYGNSGWVRSDRNATASQCAVYLFKQTQYEVSYDVTYYDNGRTGGTVPEKAEGLDAGDTYTVLAPTDLRKDEGEDTWLFKSWNTEADGSGTEYFPGNEIVISGDVNLYADWRQQTKHMVYMITSLDGVRTDVDKIAGYDRQFFAQREGSEEMIKLTKREEGTYGAKVVDNGTYVIYALTPDGAYEPVHGHKVVIFNQEGSTECLHYSVTHDAAGGTWPEGQQPAVAYVHNGEKVVASEVIPSREGYRFLGWQDQDGKIHQPGHTVTESVDRKITLTAQWEELIDVTVEIVIDHKAPQGGADNAAGMHGLSFILLRQENGEYLPVEERVLNSTEGYDPETNTTTYKVVFGGLPQGNYYVATTKANYTETITATGGAHEDQTVRADLAYAPDNGDLEFRVVVNAENEGEKALLPQAVNVKVSYWGLNEKGELGWHIITQQAGDKLPTTVMIDENGVGTGSYSVWLNHSDADHAYEYRVEVTSFVLPDGTVVPASGDLVTYKPDGSGLYTAQVSVEGEGRVPTYPEGSEGKTELTGAYFQGEEQIGTPVITVDINPMTVTFLAGEGKVNEQQTLVLENQYRYPALRDYVAVPDAEDKRFICWLDENGNPAQSLEGQLLVGDVTYTARYNDNITLTGDVIVAADYENVPIHKPDRATQVQVVLQKQVGEAWNDMDSILVDIVYTVDEEGTITPGTGSFAFTGLPNDGTQYRVQAIVLNYDASYDNNADESFVAEEAVAIIDELNATAKVDVFLDFNPDLYQQAVQVDASRIQADLRPTGVLAQILYRDLGDNRTYNVITQHTEEPFGIPMEFYAANATAIGFEDIWNWHTHGTLYEYQAEISLLYGNDVAGAYTKEGLPYTEDSPFTIHYGPSNNYLKQTYQGGVMLEAVLEPKKYPVHLDLNLGDDPDTPVLGLEKYMVDDGSGNVHYAYMHTWSYADQFTAYPYREGYVFEGWESPDTDEVYLKDGVIHVGSTLAAPITLKAKWAPLTGTDYTIRYLELNTDQVLQSASVVTGAVLGDKVVAAEQASAIEGFVYAGAMVDGQFIDKEDNPAMTVTDDATKNLMIIYYLPDGSDGYTEQVESNLSISKSAVLEDNGTYTITFDTWTKDNPITTRIQQNTPLDIVLVLDQSGSLAANDFEYLNALQKSVGNFVESVANHGRRNEVDHRIAIVGYGSDADDGHSTAPVKATGGKETDSWINTGVFDSNGEFHLYNVNGFNYKAVTNTSSITANGIYYTKVTVDGEDRYLLLTHHDEYNHRITEEQARVAALQGEKVYGYVFNEQNEGGFVELTRNSSGLWLYGNKQLYSQDEFFTYHTDVWTHRDGVESRQIHAYGVGAAYTTVDNHTSLYTRDETTASSYQQSIYEDAMVPVSLAAGGAGGTNPGLLKAVDSLGADGATRASYGMEMANEILKAHPIDPAEGRLRLVVMFTDGEPGHSGFSSTNTSTNNQAVTEANNAIKQAYTSKNTYGAYVYTIGLYESAGVSATSQVAYYMNALSSNYPNAQSMDSIKVTATYVQSVEGTAVESNGKFFVRRNNTGNTYYELKWGYVTTSGNSNRHYCWYYTRSSTNYEVSTTPYPVVDKNGKVDDFIIYQASGGYAATAHSGYYATTESADQLKSYFENVLSDITTKITTEIVLHEDTILRDIMGQGLVLTPGTVVTAYKEKGVYKDGEPEWSGVLEKVASVTIPANMPARVESAETTTIDYIHDDGTQVTRENVPYIQVYNLDSTNPTDPEKPDYHPHTVDITGYDFEHWYISEGHTEGYKMVVKITRVEARDDVQWGRSTLTNNEQSGLWLPADEWGNRELLLPFDQPTTIFVERAYVLDYGKEFTLSGWYFDDENGKEAAPVHVDCDISNGMNWFDELSPNVANGVDNPYGNTTYGNVRVEDGQVIYSPTSMNWGGYDQFYVFGDTWRKTVVSQDANQNGNLWNKVTVIPANNIYYEDSFITTESDTQNGIQGFTFTGAWSVEGTGGDNVETPEKQESAPYGDVHGWTDSLGDDQTFTDGSAHVAFANGFDAAKGARAEFTFTGTGVEVYTRTNDASGMVVAVLKRLTTDANGNQTAMPFRSLAVDNLAKSGDYYHIPTISFKDLPYGTYTMQLIATKIATATDYERYQYYIDGVRVLNPLGNTTNYQDDVVKDAYGLETNAVFTEIRDVLLEYTDFNTDMSDGTDGKLGAVFIDWIQEGQGTGNDSVGTGKPTYEVGTFQAYGPKNEVYLSAGQAVVLKVEESNTYYVGMKSLTGAKVTANLSGLNQQEPVVIQFSHTTDMYYQVTPVGGYIVIQNGGEEGTLLSLTNLRTTNLTAPAPNGGILGISSQEAIEITEAVSGYLQEKQEEEQPEPTPEEPGEEPLTPQEQAAANQVLADDLFVTVRQWLDTESEGGET